MLSGQLELAARYLAEAGRLALLLYLPQDGAVDGGGRRPAVRAPVARLEGAFDNGLQAHR